MVPFLYRLWYDAVLDWGLNPGPPALDASIDGVIWVVIETTFFNSHIYVKRTSCCEESS